MTEADDMLQTSRDGLRAMSDRDLAEAILNGSREAFGVFYERHAPKAASCLWKNKVPRDAAEDLLHDAFMAFNRNLARCEKLEKVVSWGTRLLQHDRTDYFRGRKRKDARELPEGLLQDPEDKKAGLPIDKLNAEQLRRLSEAIEALPPEQQFALVARHVHEREYAEIAKDLSEEIGTIRQRVSRARKTIRRYFAARAWEPPIGEAPAS